MIDLTLVGFVLAISTAWTAIFLGFLPAQTIRLNSGEVLKLGGAWMVVGFLALPAIRHWYFIFALICLGSWLKLRTERALAGKIWLGIAGGLGISIGIIFFLQASPAICPLTLPPRDYLLLLASIYLGSAVAGLADAGRVLARSSESHALVLSYAKLLVVLVIFWIITVGAELRMFPRSSLLLAQGHVLLNSEALLLPMMITAIFTFLAFRAARSRTPGRMKWIFADVAFLALGTQLFSRWLIL